MTSSANTAAVDHAITSRMSARAFTQQEVSRELITEILQVASRAPSGTNCPAMSPPMPVLALSSSGAPTASVWPSLATVSAATWRLWLH